MQEPTFIAGVTNPTFLLNKTAYDISCEVDIGKLTIGKTNELPFEKELYYKMDLEFINSLIYRIRQTTINDVDIRQAFTSYTKLMYDIASGAAAGLTH